VDLLHQTLIVAADHPSLCDAFAPFNKAVGELHSFEIRLGKNVQHPHRDGQGVRLAALYLGQVIATAEMIALGKLQIVVHPDFRETQIADHLSAAWAARTGVFTYSPVPHSA
jgi:hypothetical protein